MSQINRVPQGLQDLLLSKSFGKNPNELLQQVQPGVDLTRFWIVDRLTELRPATHTVIANGIQTAIEIPEGEAWIPINWSSTMTLQTAADVANWSMYIRNMPNKDPATTAALTAVVAWRDLVTAALTPETFRAAYTFPQFYLFPSTTQFQIRVDQHTHSLAEPELAQSLLYVRLSL